MADHPYSALPADRYWRKGVAGVPPFALDPTRPEAFRLTRQDRIATAGSCFAQEVARVLQEAGYNYHVTEAAPLRQDRSRQEAEARFSARYGNVYTTRHLLQLLQRSVGTFTPNLVAWRREDGRFVDPFRPSMEPDGYATEAEVAAARDFHLACVRELWRTLDTLVFTFGLTEGWIDRRDGAALPVAPGVMGGDWDQERYGFVNATVASMTEDMLGFADGLRELNPAARIVLTVSPVPIIATMEDRHVLVSNTYTKSALRVVADEVCRARPNVFYFPSYEVATAPSTVGRYFGDNLRSINDAGLRHVMRLFLRHAEGAATARHAAPLDWQGEASQVGQVICDEEALDA